MKPLTSQQIIDTPFETRAEVVLAFAFYGIHHCPEIKKFAGEYPYWTTNTFSDLSTFDSDMLTRLVISAHDQCVRVSIRSSGPRMVKIMIHPRKGREGGFSQRHPTIEQVIEQLRA